MTFAVAPRVKGRTVLCMLIGSQKMNCFAMKTSLRGFTYIGLLFAVALIGVVLAAAGILWRMESQREKELELLFIGQQYQRAINSYFSKVVDGAQEFPRTLDDLLEDKRFPNPTRHLRHRFVDPMTGSPNWGLIRKGDQIVGVYSHSSSETIRKTNFPVCCISFAGADKYNKWKFSALELSMATETLVNPLQQAASVEANQQKNPGNNETSPGSGSPSSDPPIDRTRPAWAKSQLVPDAVRQRTQGHRE